MKIKVQNWKELSNNEKQRLLSIAQELNSYTLVTNGVQLNNGRN